VAISRWPRGESLGFDAPEGSIGLGRALPPCGVESEPYALPLARAARRKLGTLCGYFRLMDFVRSRGCCGVPSVKWCVECIVFLIGMRANHGVVP